MHHKLAHIGLLWPFYIFYDVLQPTYKGADIILQNGASHFSFTEIKCHTDYFWLSKLAKQRWTRSKDFWLVVLVDGCQAHF